MAKGKLIILRVSEYIKQQHDRRDAALALSKYLKEALVELTQHSSSSNSRSSVTAHAGLILQAITWLCRAQTQPSNEDLIPLLHNICSKAIGTVAPVLQQGSLTLEQLRPVLLPCPEDGATPEIIHCLGIWARALVVRSYADLSQEEEIAWWKQAGTLQLGWYQLCSTLRLYSSSKTGARGLWLARPLLLLLSKVVSWASTIGPPIGPVMSIHGVTVARLGMISVAARPSAHPGLRRWLPSSSLPAKQLEVCGVNIQSALQQQEMWWAVAAMCLATLATCVKPQQPRPLQAARFCPDYSNNAFASSSKSWTEATQDCSCVLQDLLLAEVWWLWPWQLQVLEAGAAKAAAVPAATGSSSSSSSSSRTKGFLAYPHLCAIATAAATAVMSTNRQRLQQSGGQAAAAATSHTEEGAEPGATGDQVAATPATHLNQGHALDSGRTTNSNSSSSSSVSSSNDGDGGTSSSSSSSECDGVRTSSTGGSSQQQQQQRVSVLETIGSSHHVTCQVPVLLSPHLGCVSTASPPPKVPLRQVTRQQLQVVVGIVAHGNGPLRYQAGLLLALLLRRADPGLRAAFLNGPEASLLLAALIDLTSWEEFMDESCIVPAAFRQTGSLSWGAAKEVLLGAWEGAEFPHELFMRPSVVVLLMTLWFLQPCPQRCHPEQQQQQQNGEEEAADWGAPYAVTTGAGHVAGAAAGVVLLAQVPHTLMELVPGVQPTPLLIGAIGAAVSIAPHTGVMLDLECVAALVAACCQALKQPRSQEATTSSSSSGGTPVGCSSSSGECSGSSSSSSSLWDARRSTGGSSGAAAAIRRGVVEAFAALAITSTGTCMVRSWSSPADIPGLTSAARHVSCWAVVAMDLLQLAVHEVEVGRAGRATLSLAAAAQQLGCAVLQKGKLWAKDVLTAMAHSGGPDAASQARRNTLSVASFDLVAGIQGVLDSLTGLEVAVGSLLAPVSSAVDPSAEAAAGGIAAPSLPPLPAAAAAAPAAAAPAAAAGLQDATTGPMADEGLLQQQQQQQGHQRPGVGGECREVVVDENGVVQACCATYALGELLSAVGAAIAGCTLLNLVGCSWYKCGSQVPLGTVWAVVAGRKGVRCGGCGLARYCCPQHQQEDWPRHRHVCRRLAMAKAAAAGTATAAAAATAASTTPGEAA